MMKIVCILLFCCFVLLCCQRSEKTDPVGKNYPIDFPESSVDYGLDSSGYIRLVTRANCSELDIQWETRWNGRVGFHKKTKPSWIIVPYLEDGVGGRSFYLAVVDSSCEYRGLKFENDDGSFSFLNFRDIGLRYSRQIEGGIWVGRVFFGARVGQLLNSVKKVYVSGSTDHLIEDLPLFGLVYLETLLLSD